MSYSNGPTNPLVAPHLCFRMLPLHLSCPLPINGLFSFDSYSEVTIHTVHVNTREEHHRQRVVSAVYLSGVLIPLEMLAIVPPTAVPAPEVLLLHPTMRQRRQL